MLFSYRDVAGFGSVSRRIPIVVLVAIAGPLEIEGTMLVFLPFFLLRSTLPGSLRLGISFNSDVIYVSNRSLSSTPNT